jgi:ACT domain-containing protein
MVKIPCNQHYCTFCSAEFAVICSKVVKYWSSEFLYVWCTILLYSLRDSQLLKWLILLFHVIQNTIYNVWRNTLNLRDSVNTRRIMVQHLQKELRLYDILKEQVNFFYHDLCISHNHISKLLLFLFERQILLVSYLHKVAQLSLAILCVHQREPWKHTCQQEAAWNVAIALGCLGATFGSGREFIALDSSKAGSYSCCERC